MSLHLCLLGDANSVHLRRWVVEMQQRGFRVSVVTARPEPIAGVEQRVLAPVARASDWLWRVGQARRHVAELAPDIVHAHYVTSYGYLAARCGRHPLVMTAWGSDILVTPNKNRGLRWLTGWTLRQADLITGDSLELLERIADFAPRAPLHQIHWGADMGKFRPVAWSAKLGFQVVSLRAWEPNYNIDVIVEAVALLRQRVPDAGVHLHLLGGGALEGELRTQVQALGMASHVSFHGRVDDAAMVKTLQACKASVSVPTSDATSVSVLESMACGLPVIASDLPANRQWLAAGEGVLVGPRDAAALAAALEALCRDDAGAQRVAQVNHERMLRDGARSVQMDAMAAHYQGLLNSMRSSVSDHDLATQPAAQTVSVIVPCRDERRYIEGFCANVLRQALPGGWALQLVIADGMSDDGTRELLAQLSTADPRVRWIDNPQRIVSTALNAALASARGGVIVRMDVHTEYAADYIAQCLAALQNTGADNVGGPWCAQPDPQAAPMQVAIAAAFQSRWVAGGALSRRLDFDGWVDTVYLGCWPRASFERFGGFDETLVRNQDDEHNLRIVRGGGRVWQSSRIRSVYRPRATLRQVFRQYMQYGYWKPFVMKKHGQAAALRHLVPGLFVALLAALGAAVLFGAPAWPLAGLAALYAGVVGVLTAAVAVEQGVGPAALARVPAVIAAYHVGYGIGSLLGWCDALRHGRGRARFASLTR